MSNAKVELTNIELENVTGGAYWYAGKHAVDKKHKWELIDDVTGKILGSFATAKQAKSEARLHGLSVTRYYFLSTILKKRDAYDQHMRMSPDLLYRQNGEWVNPF